MDEVKQSLDHEGMQPTGGKPEDFGKRIRTDYARWSKLVESGAVKLK